MKAKMRLRTTKTVILTPAMIATARPTMTRVVGTLIAVMRVMTIAARADTATTIAMNKDTVTG